jgi:hypothetical protein
MSDTRPPPILDKIVDLVLSYRPKPKTEGAKKRKSKAKKLKKKASGKRAAH